MQRLLPLALAVLLASGCASAAKATRRTPSLVERPPVNGVREHQVKDRTTSLWRTGKFASRADARKAAEKDFPDTDAGESAEWSRQYREAERAKIAEDKLEADLEKLYRK